MQSQTKSFQWPVRVYYEDTDAGGVVYHANYLNFFERARTEYLRSLEINQHSLLELKTGFVVRHMDIDFIQAAKLDDQLVVHTQVTQIKRASLDFCQKLVNLDGLVLCSAQVKIACVNMEKMKPQAIPTTILSELKRVG
ncbi:MAG: tol-pal system-associated acyl-CoA thioesterase [Vibrio sp.]